MGNTILTPDLVRDRMQIIHRVDNSTVTSYSDIDGDISSTVYELIPGVKLIYKDIHRNSFISNWRHPPDDVLVIEYCREGRIECQIDDDCLYVAPGDVVMYRTDHAVRNLSYPLNHYHATAITISLEEVPEKIINFLRTLGTDERELIHRYMLDRQKFCVLKRNRQMEQVYEQMRSSPEAVRTAYLSVKILEILLLLISMVPDIDVQPSRKISWTQAARAKEAYQFLMAHPESRITIKALAKQMSISETLLKQSFRIVYGVPIQSFTREQKMKAAAVMLKQTDLKVADIAMQFGYSNPSKFSAAFQTIMGKTPNDYRSDAASTSVEESPINQK